MMTPRPGRIAREIASPLTGAEGTRVDPAYTALVAEIGHSMEAAMAAATDAASA